MKKNKARKWMKDNVGDHTDKVTGEVNCTSLAEECCQVFKCNDIGGPLDDETHWVWDIAADVAAKAER